jgi:transcriptional antiterminator RfaH
MAVEWFVLHSKPHKEELLAEQLELPRIETFYPRIRVQVVNPRARKVRPYFPRHVFMHVDLDKMGLSALHYCPVPLA